MSLHLLEWHATGQVALINVQTGAVKKVGQPGMVRSIDASPDGNYLRVTRMTKPFSYIVPGQQLRIDRGGMGWHRQGPRETERTAAQSRRSRG